MSVEQMNKLEIDVVCDALSYIPTRNVVGLHNGTACIRAD